jgi:hypothetical protein
MPLRSFTVIDDAVIAVTTPPAMSGGLPGGAGVAVVAVVASRADSPALWVVADANPAPPATSPSPSAAVAAARFAVVLVFLFMMILSLFRFETISHQLHRPRRT